MTNHSKLFLKSLVWRNGEGNGSPLQYSCLENPMDRGTWWAAVHGVAKSQTRLSDFTFTFHFHALEKEMATHSSVLAWRIPGMGEPGWLLSMGSHRAGYNRSDLAAAAVWRKVVWLRKCKNYFDMKMKVAQSCLTLNCFQPHALEPTRLLCPWNAPAKNTGVGCHFLLQGIFPTQGSNCIAGKFFTIWATREALWLNLSLKAAREC